MSFEIDEEGIDAEEEIRQLIEEAEAHGRRAQQYGEEALLEELEAAHELFPFFQGPIGPVFPNFLVGASGGPGPCAGTTGPTRTRSGG